MDPGASRALVPSAQGRPDPTSQHSKVPAEEASQEVSELARGGGQEGVGVPGRRNAEVASRGQRASRGSERLDSGGRGTSAELQGWRGNQVTQGLER